MGRDKFFDLLGRHQLLVKRRRKYALTTQSYHRFHTYANLIKNWVPQRSNQLWAVDITYVRTQQGFVYLFLLTDAYSRKIVGWQLSHSLAVEGAVQALKMAIRQAGRIRELIHHSDRGIQYCCKEYIDLLNNNGIAISMAEAGNCYENALAERVNGILKDEYGLEQTFKGHSEALQATKEAIRAYNEKRPHWSLNLRTPAQVHVAA